VVGEPDLGRRITTPGVRTKNRREANTVIRRIVILIFLPVVVAIFKVCPKFSSNPGIRQFIDAIGVLPDYITNIFHVAKNCVPRTILSVLRKPVPKVEDLSWNITYTMPY
jgi:hypothetical protein